MRLALAALQGAVFGLLAMRIAESESLRFVLYGAIAFPLCSAILSARSPRLAAVLGLFLVGLWATTCGVMAYEDAALEAWEWIPLLAFIGLLFGAAANSYLFRGIASLEGSEPTTETQQRAESEHQAAEPQPPSPSPSTDPWTVLGIAPGASAHEIQRAFRARMSEYHPDKVATLGAELRKLAEVRIGRISGRSRSDNPQSDNSPGDFGLTRP